MILPLSLTFAALCAILNLWLSMRVGQARGQAKILHGDGGNPYLVKKMRAHANFVEYAPFVLILFVLVELAYGSQSWLWAVIVAYALARIVHALGMDADKFSMARGIGISINHLVLLGLAGAALYAAYGFTQPAVTTVNVGTLNAPAQPAQSR